MEHIQFESCMLQVPKQIDIFLKISFSKKNKNKDQFFEMTLRLWRRLDKNYLPVPELFKGETTSKWEWDNWAKREILSSFSYLIPCLIPVGPWGV